MKLKLDDWGTCFSSEDMQILFRSTLSHPAVVECELDSFTHSFSQTANELEQREHWHEIEGRVKCESSMV
jgi:hypothetical protein